MFSLGIACLDEHKQNLCVDYKIGTMDKLYSKTNCIMHKYRKFTLYALIST